MPITKGFRALVDEATAQITTYTVADVANDYWEQHVARVRKQKGVTEVKRMFDTMLGETGAVPAVDLTRSQAFDLIRVHGETKPVIAGYLRSELGAAWDPGASGVIGGGGAKVAVAARRGDDSWTFALSGELSQAILLGRGSSLKFGIRTPAGGYAL